MRAAARAEPVSLRSKGGGPEVYDDRMVTWVCPGHLRKYVKEMTRLRGSENEPIKEREVYIGALELDKALEEGLKRDEDRLKAAAEAHGLSLEGEQYEENYRRLIVQLVKAGLDAAEVKPPKLKK